MAFKKRKADRRKLDAPIFSGAAEVCETRALLSADGVCMPAVDADAVVIEDIEATEFEEVIDVDATVEDGEFIPELAVCTMLPMIEGEVEVLGEEVGGEEGEVLIAEEDVDPSLMFYSFMSFEGGEPEVAVCDGLVIEEEPVFKGDGEEEVVIDGEEPVEVTFEDFDPSWIKRSFGAPTGEVVDDLAFTCDVVDKEVVLDDVVEEEVVVDEEFVDVTTLEDYDPSWAFRSFVTGVPDDGTEVIEGVVDGEEKPEVIEEEFFDITTVEDYDPSWAYRGTVIDGEKVVIEEEVVDGEEEAVIDEEVVVEEGEVTEEEFVTLEDGGEVPVRHHFGMNFRGNTGGELPVEILAMTTGMPAVPGVESTSSVMGPVAPATPVAAPVVNVPVVNQPVSLPVVVTPALAIPVNSSGFAPLFVEEEELLVSALAPVVSEIEPLVSEVEVTVSSGLDSEFGDFIGSSSDSSDAAVGELTPIFEDEQDEEESVEVPAAEDVPVETEESVSSVDVPQQPVVVASRANYGRSIDEFMSEFAMSGFAG